MTDMAQTHSSHPEHRESLWMLTISPAVWSLHFLASYITAAVWCAKYAPANGSLWPVRVAIGVYTAVALAIIGVTAVVGYRRHRSGSGSTPHDRDTHEDRHRFLGFATLLLSLLSAVATIYVALVAVFVGSCD